MAVLFGKVEVNKGRIHPFWFDFDIVRESTQISPDTSSPIVEDDKNITRYTASTSGEKVTLSPIPTYSSLDEFIGFSFYSDNPTEIGVDIAGNVVFQVEPEQTATATITVTGTQGDNVVSRNISITLSISGAATIDVIEGGVAGSARKALSDVIDNALSGASPATQQLIFTTQDHSTQTYVRNTSFFLSGVSDALTCASPWNSSLSNKKAGTAITKRHAVLANHYNYGIGTVVRFIASDNSVVDRTVVQAQSILYNGNTTDSWMVLFDSDLPSSITPCKIFPSGFDSYLPAGSDQNSFAATDIPLLALDQQEKGLVLDYTKIHPTSTTPRVVFGTPVLVDRIAFNETIVEGDSGNPVFCVVGSELWLLSTFFTAVSGPFYGDLVTELNAMIVTLDTLQNDLTGYTVTEGDLSSYTTYP